MSPAEPIAMLMKLPTAAAEPIGDASSSRLLIGLVIGLFVLGVALLVLAWWVAHATRYEPEALAPLEVMGTRTWLDADDDVKVELLELARPHLDAESAKVEPSTPVVDSETKRDGAEAEPVGDGAKTKSDESAGSTAKPVARQASAAAASADGTAAANRTRSNAADPVEPARNATADKSDPTPEGIEAELTRSRLQKQADSNVDAASSPSRPPTAKSITDSITTGPKRSSAARRAAVLAKLGLTSNPDEPADSQSSTGSTEDIATDPDATPARRSEPGDPGRSGKSPTSDKSKVVDKSNKPAAAAATPRRPDAGESAGSKPIDQSSRPVRPANPEAPRQTVEQRRSAESRPEQSQGASDPSTRKPVARPKPGSPEVVVVEQSPVAEIVVIDTAPDSARPATPVQPPPPPPRPAAAKSPSDEADKPTGSNSPPIPGEPIL